MTFRLPPLSPGKHITLTVTETVFRIHTNKEKGKGVEKNKIW